MHYDFFCLIFYDARKLEINPCLMIFSHVPHIMASIYIVRTGFSCNNYSKYIRKL